MLRRRDAAIDAANDSIAAHAGTLEAERAGVLAQAQTLATDEQQGALVISEPAVRGVVRRSLRLAPLKGLRLPCSTHDEAPLTVGA